MLTIGILIYNVICRSIQNALTNQFYCVAVGEQGPKLPVMFQADGNGGFMMMAVFHELNVVSPGLSTKMPLF